MNVKKSLYFLFLFGMGFIILLESCTKEDLSQEFKQDFFISVGGEQIRINTQEALEDYIMMAAPDNFIKEIESASFGKEITEKDEFFVVKAKYRLQDNRLVSLVIPLEELTYKSSNHGVIFNASCTMTCTPKDSCEGCDQTITGKCQGQICNCNRQSNVPGTEASCDSNIAF